MTNDSNNGFDAFISYFEETGSDNAETIRDNLKRYSINAFVAHIERSNYAGSFEEKINNVIANCRYFILLINIDTLGREQVVRECKRAYPNGLTEHPQFIIFREDLEHVERASETFLIETGIDISKQNQHDFRTDPQLAGRVSSLCRSCFFVKVEVTSYQPAKEREQYASDPMISRNMASVENFQNTVQELGLWTHCEIKVFLFKSNNDVSWKVQFLYIRLLEYAPNQLLGLTTQHLRFMHQVREINELDNILNQIALAKQITLDNVAASLELIPNEIKYDSLYKSHPQSEIFGVNQACYELLKSGDRSSELAENERLLISEFEGLFDYLSDAVVNRLDLQFWDGTYAPFMVIVAPIPIEIVTAEINSQDVLMTLDCSPLIDPRRLKVMLHGRNVKGRQVGAAQSITSFRRLDNRQISLDTNILLNNTITYLTLRLYYYNDLIQERYFKKDEITNRWVQS
jgi:hypothetical protein